MEIIYEIKHRNVKYPRLEFKGLTLQVILPNHMKDATELLKKRKNWIQKKWSTIQEAIKNVNSDKSFAILGEVYKIEKGEVEKPIIDAAKKEIKFDPTKPKHQEIIEKELKNLLKKRVKPIVNEYSEKLNFQPSRITIRKQKTKWGSCSRKKNLSLNLKLALLPEEMIRYVVYHEMLHLKQKKHNQTFWDKIREEFPDYKQIEKKLLEQWFHTETLLKI